MVGGSNPPCPTKSNPFPQNNLAVSPSRRPSAVSVEVSNRASKRRRTEIVSRRLEQDEPRDEVLAFSPTHKSENLISRIQLAATLGVKPQMVAKWQRLQLFPQPKACLSDRLILYDREEVRRAIEHRKAMRRLRVAPARREK